MGVQCKEGEAVCRQNREQGGPRDESEQAENEGVTEDTLLLQNRAGVLQVKGAVTSFPVVAAPPETGSTPWPFHQMWEECSPAGDGVGHPAQTDGRWRERGK